MDGVDILLALLLELAYRCTECHHHQTCMQGKLTTVPRLNFEDVDTTLATPVKDVGSANTKTGYIGVRFEAALYVNKGQVSGELRHWRGSGMCVWNRRCGMFIITVYVRDA
jgi:hypothetical protein